MSKTKAVHDLNSSIRAHYYADYTESMETKTLILIRRDLLKCSQIRYDSSWHAKRLARINQVLRSRNELPK
jgi:hypothetical protein